MSKRILVIDDEEIIRKGLKIHLTKSGYEVKEAANGEEAIEQVKKNNFDLLICDIMMPKKDGWEVLKFVRSQARTKDLPVIFLTAKNQEADMFKGYELGANYYIPKPFTTSQVFMGINMMFGKERNPQYY
jgi:DNA-binding response OmpR family regulator